MGVATTYEILLSLQEMFGDKDKPTRQVALRIIMNTRMIKGIPVRDHMFCMIALFNEMEILGAIIDRETPVWYDLRDLTRLIQVI